MVAPIVAPNAEQKVQMDVRTGRRGGQYLQQKIGQMSSQQ